MSLQIWLPLDGKVENKGLNNFSITTNTATINNEGKIGQCYSFDGTNCIRGTTTKMSTTTWSVACWIYTTKTTTSGHHWWITYHSASTASNMFFGLCSYSSKFSIRIDGSTYQGPSITLNKWYHVAVVYNNTELKFYLNGILTNTTTATTPVDCNPIITIGSRNGLAGNFQGRINDVRIYNHCLSTAEVKEIAQGLILHYKLDQGGINWNLLHDTNAPSLTAIKSSKNRYFESAGSGTYTCTFEQITDPPVPGIIYGIRQQVSSVNGFHSQVWYSGANVSAFNNITHTMSCYVKRISGTNLKLKFQYGKSPYVNTTVDISNDNDWHQYSWTFVPSGSAASSNTTKYYVGGLFSVGEILICGWKVERSDYATPWTPSYAELQEQIGIDATEVVDSSGYGHYGTQLAASQGGTSARNNNCTTITDGTTNYITTPELYFNKEAITMNIWFKSQNTAPTGNYHMVVDSVSNRTWYEMCINYSGYFRAGLTVNDTRYADNCSTTTALNGQWHMLTLTYDGATIKRYFDGELEKSTTVAISSGLSGPTALRIGRDGPNASYACQQAQLSDFRIYCTPLLDTDIKQLYNVSMKIDKNNNIQSFTFIEKQRNIMAAQPLSDAYTHRDAIQYPCLYYNNKGEIELTEKGSVGSNYIPINPDGHTYYYDITISISAGNQVHLGWERWDANKTSVSNQAAVYAISMKPSTDIVKKRYRGTINLSVSGSNPCKYIVFRLLNAWTGTATDSQSTVIIHNLSLREVDVIDGPSIAREGNLIADEYKEDSRASMYKNGIVEATNIIER